MSVVLLQLQKFNLKKVVKTKRMKLKLISEFEI